MAEQEQSSIMNEVQDARKETKAERNTIENILKSSDDAMKAKKEELFFAELNKELEGKTDKDGNQITITSYNQLTVAQRRELENYKIPDDEMKKMFEGTRNEIKDLTTQRSEALDSLGDKIEELYKEAQENINRINQELQNPDLKEEERKSLEDELDRWTRISDEIGPDKGSESLVRKTLAQAMDNHDQARMNGVEGMALIYPKELVYNDPEVKNKIVPAKKRDEFNKQAQGEQNKEQGENVADKEQANGKAPQVKADPAAAKAAQQMAGQQAAAGAATLGDDVEPEMDLEPDYLALLGYNADNALNFENSCDLLDKFANGLTDKARLEMLNNPECKRVVLNALAVTGKNLNPRKAKMFNDTRDRILRLAKGPMMEMALRDMGIEDPKNIKKEFNALNKEYNSSRADLEQQLKDNPENKEAIQAKIDELDEKYKSIKNVDDFQKSSKKIRTIRSTFREFKDAVLNKDSYKALAEKAHDAIYEEKQDVSNNAKSQEKVEDKDTPSFMNSDLVNNKEDVAKKDAEKIKNDEHVYDGPDMKFAQAFKEADENQKKKDEGQER